MAFFNKDGSQQASGPSEASGAKMAFSNEPKSIQIDSVGEATKERWIGTFKVKTLLSHRDSLRRDQIRRELLGTLGTEAGGDALKMADVFSKIWVHVVEAPAWWSSQGNGLDMVDSNPAVDLYKAIVTAELEVYGVMEKDAKDAQVDLKKAADEKK